MLAAYYKMMGVLCVCRELYLITSTMFLAFSGSLKQKMHDQNKFMYTMPPDYETL